MKIQVADIVVRKKEIELPAYCPHCGRYLTENSLILCFLEYGYYDSHLYNGEIAPKLKDGENNGYCETSFPCVAVFCECYEIIWSGEEKMITQNYTAYKETVWSESLNKLVFKKAI